MKIGIVGCGIVGGATAFGMAKAGYEVIQHDPKFGTSIDVVKDCHLTYICVPTPKKEDGSCDISVVESVVSDLSKLDNSVTRTLVLKSTVPPGTCDYLSEKYNIPVYFVPEFLRERCAITDFVENHKILVVGWPERERSARPFYSDSRSLIARMIIESHGKYPKTVKIMRSREAELLKYFHNTINALRITIANEFYDIAHIIKADYTTVKNALLTTTDLPDIYLDVNENVRGYSSVCFNKDIPALRKFAEGVGLGDSTPIISNIEKSNDLRKKTPFTGTRE